MGLMTQFFGGKSDIQNGKASPIDGNHAISKESALANTNNAVPTPTNVQWDSVRTAPVVPAPRYFSKQESDALKTLAKQKREMANHSRTAYKSLRSIDSSDTEVHQVHRQYQGRLAKNEVQKLSANAQLAEQLHALRPEYAQLGTRIDLASNNAGNAINAIKQSYGVNA